MRPLQDSKIGRGCFGRWKRVPWCSRFGKEQKGFGGDRPHGQDGKILFDDPGHPAPEPENESECDRFTVLPSNIETLAQGMVDENLCSRIEILDRAEEDETEGLLAGTVCFGSVPCDPLHMGGGIDLFVQAADPVADLGQGDVRPVRFRERCEEIFGADEMTFLPAVCRGANFFAFDRIFLSCFLRKQYSNFCAAGQVLFVRESIDIVVDNREWILYFL